MELSMKDTFPACVKILQERRQLMHYRDLTKAMLQSLGIAKHEVIMDKEIENIREKLLIAGQRGTFYVPRPYCLAGLRWWFSTDQLQFNMDTIFIPGDIRSGIKGGFEAMMRSPFMEVHNKRLANTELLNRTRVRGLVVEAHVADWFSYHFSEFYRIKSNDGQWANPAHDDFRLVIKDHVYTVDVAGPDQHNLYGHRGKKLTADLHLLCRTYESGVLWEGAVRGTQFGQNVIPETVTSPSAVCVWLNCVRQGIDYRAIADHIAGGRLAA